MDNTRYIEVGQVDMPTRVQQHVGWLDISMDDTVFSEILQSKAELCYVESDTRHSESALFFQVIADITTCEWCVDVCIKWNFKAKPNPLHSSIPGPNKLFFHEYTYMYLKSMCQIKHPFIRVGSLCDVVLRFGLFIIIYSLPNHIINGHSFSADILAKLFNYSGQEMDGSN